MWPCPRVSLAVSNTACVPVAVSLCPSRPVTVLCYSCPCPVLCTLYVVLACHGVPWCSLPHAVCVGVAVPVPIPCCACLMVSLLLSVSHADLVPWCLRDPCLYPMLSLPHVVRVHISWGPYSCPCCCPCPMVSLSVGIPTPVPIPRCPCPMLPLSPGVSWYPCVPPMLPLVHVVLVPISWCPHSCPCCCPCAVMSRFIGVFVLWHFCHGPMVCLSADVPWCALSHPVCVPVLIS